MSKPGTPPKVSTPNRWLAPAVCVVLVMLVAVVFGQTVGHGFVDIDDDQYIRNNPHVTAGLTLDGVRWSLTSCYASNWHPLTWLSHMTDCQLYGVQPWGHHLTNVLLHATNVVLLFLVLWRMTGALWPSALTAMVFAIHPLRAESVAWVAERKDLLCGLFFFLTLGAYVSYVRHRFSWWRYGMVVALFALGLMAKPMLVTLPFVLLLLDYWPLQRVKSGEWRVESKKQDDRSHSSLSTLHSPLSTLVLEKLPLLALSAVSCVLTRWAQTEAIVSTATIPLGDRVTNALVAYAAYLGQFFYPVGLSPLYPHPGHAISFAAVFGSALLLAGVSLAAWFARRRWPYVPVGWFWYLGMMVPVIGLVQVGIQARADRYTYLPQIGLCIALIWAAADLTPWIPRRRWLLSAAAVMILLDLTMLGWLQASYWRNGETLWTHVVSDHPDNATAHNNLGTLLANRGQLDAAFVCFQKALEQKPDMADAYNNLGGVWMRRGQPDEAIACYQKAVALQPDLIQARCNLGRLLSEQKRWDEAIQQFQEVLRRQPDNVAAHYNLGTTLAQQGHFAEAVASIRRAIASADRHGDAATADSLRERLQLYQAEIERNPSSTSHGAPSTP